MRLNKLVCQVIIYFSQQFIDSTEGIGDRDLKWSRSFLCLASDINKVNRIILTGVKIILVFNNRDVIWVNG